MIYVKAFYNTAAFTGEALFQFDNEEYSTDKMMFTYAGEYENYELISQEEWDESGLNTYIAYPVFGYSFIFAIDADLFECDEITDCILSNVDYWDTWPESSQA